MSEQLPKIYGTCPAGCRWETVHRSEFEKSASHIKQYMQDDGLYHLEVGKEYKAVEEQANDEFNACLSVELIYDGDISIKKLFDGVKNPDPFSNTFTFKVLGLSDVDGIISIVYEFCGVRYSESVDIVEEITGVCLDWGGELYLYNADAKIKAENGKSAYEIAVEYGFEGTEQEWLETFTHGADGKTPYIKDGNWWIGDTDTGVKAEGKDGTTQLVPLFANSIEECTDTSKLYVLPNGDIYAYMKTTTVGGGVKKNYAKLLYSEWLPNTRLSTDSTQTNDTTYAGTYVTPYIPCSYEQTICFKGLDVRSITNGGNARYHICGSDKALIVQDAGYIKDLFTQGYASIDGDVISIKAGMIASSSGSFNKNVVYQRFCGVLMEGYTIDDVIITVDEEITEVEVITEEKWADTGRDFIPGDYEDDIVALNERVTGAEISNVECEKRLSAIEDELNAAEDDINVPSYWREHLEEKADLIQRAMETAGREKSAFLWYTDAHWTDNSKVSPALLAYLCKNTPINKINFGGDIIGDPSSFTHNNIKYVYEWRKLIANLPNHHSVYGNHDLNHWATDVSKMAYALLLAPEESADMVVGGDSYYYIDNPSEKTRYLYLTYLPHYPLDSETDKKKAQGDFIVEAISSVGADWHIVVIAHRWYQYLNNNGQIVIEGGGVPAYEAEILSIFDTYNARGTIAGLTYFGEQNFANSKGKVEFCIGGHVHFDYDFTSMGGIPVIITASDTNQNRNDNETEDNGTIGDITESAVFGIVADYDNRKIIVVGVGRGTSREISY